VWYCPTCLGFCLLLNWFGLQECKQVKNDGKFYHFQHNTRAVKPEIVHFQVSLWIHSFLSPCDVLFVSLDILWQDLGCACSKV